MPLKTFLINKINSKKFRLNGLVPSSRLPKKRQLCQSFRDHILYSPQQLPPKVDLRSDMTPVENQSQIGSCAANCLAGAYEYLTKKANGRNIDVSRLFIYYNARVIDQKSTKVTDSGCSMTSAIEALEEFGTCLESVWPYDISRVNTRPNDSAYQEAQHHKITQAFRIDINLYEMKACLAQGFPFAFGLKLYSSFDQAAHTGIVPMPNVRDNGRQSHGSHALLAVGYSDQSKAFIVRNSWGEQWGDKGYCYIPYDYITNPNYSFDVWTVRKLATDNFGRDHWDIHDTINHTHIHNHKNHWVHINVDDDGRVIEVINEDDDHNRKNDFNDHSNQFRRHGGGNNHFKHDDQHHHRHEGHHGNRNFHCDQFPEQDNFFGFRGGSSDSDQFMNNGPNFFNNPFPSPPEFFGPQHYGSNYGYSGPSNNFFDRFFK